MEDSMHTCSTQRPRRPLLTDSIARLDEMIDGLSTAIPGAVAESVREVLGSNLVTAIRDAVREAVKEGVREAVQAAVVETASASAARAVSVSSRDSAVSPQSDSSRTGRLTWSGLLAVGGRIRRWSARRVAPVVARLAIGWAIVKLVGGSTIRNRSAAMATAMVGATAGYTGYVAGPIGSAVLLGLAGGAITAVAAWTAPTFRLLVALREEQAA
jgi:hypothetical protein